VALLATKKRIELKFMSKMGFKFEIRFFMHHQAAFCVKSSLLVLVTKKTKKT